MVSVGLRERLFRLAELELRNAARRIRGGARNLVEEMHRLTDDPFDDLPPLDEPPKRSVDRTPPEIRRYYANLELPVGASVEQVKTAYRRLMRQYHPDRHATDPQRARVATEVAQQLRRAYEGLLAYLGDRSGSS